MSESDDIKSRIAQLLQGLPVEQLAELNDAIRDALISAATGRPSRFPVNELVHISQEEAQRICRKIGLDWETGRMERD